MLFIEIDPRRKVTTGYFTKNTRRFFTYLTLLHVILRSCENVFVAEFIVNTTSSVGR